MLAGALGAAAATSPARYSVTLSGTIVDVVSYDQTRPAGEECRVQRRGSGQRALAVRSVRAVTIAVSRSGSRAVYRPTRFAVRLTGTAGGGSYDETRICRAAPIERRHADCRRESLARRRVSVRFVRPTRNRVAFVAPRQADQIGACGLDRLVAAGWLDQALGKVDEETLLRRRARRIVVRGSATTSALIGDPVARIERRTTVRWTLTFRRL